METTAREAVGAKAQPVARAARRRAHDEPSLARQIVLQLLCLAVLATVLFPIIWVFSVSLDPLNRSRPEGLSLIPAGATFESYEKVLEQPTNNPISFVGLLGNSLKVSLGTALVSVLIGVFAAYAFSRLRFRGRAPLMLVILGVLMLPTVATLTPLFVLLNSIKVDLPLIGAFNLRQSLLGVGLAIVSGLLPFAIWNLKGYLDTIPRDLEEAAAVDGADIHQTFLRIILPLSMPALAVTAFLGFIAGWTEFYFTSTFLSGSVENHTLALALNAMRGNFASTPWSAFSAFAILVAIPPAIVYLFAQRWITSGLAIGAVKG
ncbi:MAG TPA: ABC transporter permease subunit [Candidatus Sulfomarinibacteraceae bacterium]|nr:ABC transporter permease subunit [Candidatus Sulfomarinibacteraceae bacterium]